MQAPSGLLDCPPVAPPVRVGVAGLGRTGLYHLERLSLREDCRAVAVYDAAPERQSLAADFGCSFHPSWAEFLGCEEIEVVLVTGPPDNRAPLARAALEAGKHVLADQPLSLTSREAAGLIATAQRTGRTLAVVQPRRTEPDFRAALESARGGHLGEIVHLKKILWELSLADGVGDAGGHRFPIEIAGHVFDQLFELLPADPLSVEARVFSPGRDGERGKHGFLALIEFPGGVTAHVEIDPCAIVPLQTGWVIAGSSGAYHGGRRFSLTAAGEVVDQSVESVPAGGDDPYSGLVQQLRAGVSALNPPLASWRVVRMIEAVRESAECGAPVGWAVSPESSGRKAE